MDRFRVQTRKEIWATDQTRSEAVLAIPYLVPILVLLASQIFEEACDAMGLRVQSPDFASRRSALACFVTFLLMETDSIVLSGVVLLRAWLARIRKRDKTRSLSHRAIILCPGLFVLILS